MEKYYWRIFLWENGHKSTEYTHYTAAPIFIEDKLDETLDTGEIIFDEIPTAPKADEPQIKTKPFPSKTKFRLERYLTEDFSDTPETWDFVVDHDDVEEYVGCPEICTHRVHLIEPSVIAQGMHVDNIALTYELQDVTLAYKTTAGNNDKADPQIIGAGADTPVYIDDDIGNMFLDGDSSEGSYRTTFNYYWDNLDDAGDAVGINNLTKFISPNTSMTISVNIPKLHVQTGDTFFDTVSGATGNRWLDVCELPTKTTVTKVRYKHYVEMENGAPVVDAVDDWKLIPGKRTEQSKETVATANSGATTFSAATCVREGRTSIFNKNKVVYTTIFDGPPYPLGNPMWDGKMTTVQDQTDYFLYVKSTNLGNYLLSKTVSNPASVVTFTTAQIPEAEQKGNDEEGYYVIYDEYTIKTVADFGDDGNIRLPTVDAYFGHIELSGDAELPYKLVTSKNSTASRGVSAKNLFVTATVNVQDKSTATNSALFLTSPAKYNCYKLLRKALLTCETRLIASGLDSIEYPICISQTLRDKLINTDIYETVFEQKNLWEVLLQIGYYIHAIPYLEFATDGTDRFELKFKELGSKEVKPDTSGKITVFNSRNLSEYFSQLDSYVTNLFSPQNEVEEWIVIQTEDTSKLASNDNALLHTKYNISEMLDFAVRKNADGNAFVPILNRIFEKSVYSVLSCSPDVFPSKAATIYYTYGDNKIEGFDYVPTQKNEGDNVTALSRILMSLFGLLKDEVKYSDYTFYVKYRTQDSARVTQFRPDLLTFIKNSALERYPHHEQYYGQQDKIVDSERFSANLFGRLIRVGNAVYQRQEKATAASEKKSGDLIEINGEPYYVTVVENEYYADAILQKVTYSKNFNQLANIVTIPSEPRFYEVSERSQVRREVRLAEFVQLSTESKTGRKYTYLGADGITLLKKIMFGVGSSNFPNYAYSQFRADSARIHENSHGENIADNKLFPSTLIVQDPTDSNKVYPAASSNKSECVVPLLHFPMRNSIIFEWDMDDNYKAGDSVAVTNHLGANVSDGAYMTMQGVRYCDVMGRADLFGFKLFHVEDVSRDDARKFPGASGYNMDTNTVYAMTPSNVYVGLDKDNREAMSFNYQISLLHDDPNFVTFSNLFGDKKSPLKVCLLKETVSPFDEVVDFHKALAFLGDVVITGANPISVAFNISESVNLDDVKAIVLYEEDNDKMYPYLARNVDKLTNEFKIKPWFLYPALA